MLLFLYKKIISKGNQKCFDQKFIFQVNWKLYDSFLFIWIGQISEPDGRRNYTGSKNKE